jgi:hypothetical protein
MGRQAAAEHASAVRVSGQRAVRAAIQLRRVVVLDIDAAANIGVGLHAHHDWGLNTTPRRV